MAEFTATVNSDYEVNDIVVFYHKRDTTRIYGCKSDSDKLGHHIGIVTAIEANWSGFPKNPVKYEILCFENYDWSKNGTRTIYRGVLPSAILGRVDVSQLTALFSQLQEQGVLSSKLIQELEQVNQFGPVACTGELDLQNTEADYETIVIIEGGHRSLGYNIRNGISVCIRRFRGWENRRCNSIIVYDTDGDGERVTIGESVIPPMFIPVEIIIGK